MMKSSSPRTFYVFLSIAVACNAPFATAQTNLSIFETSARVSMHLSPEQTQFSMKEIFNVEKAATSYLTELITREESLRFLNDPKNVLKLTVDIEEQTINEDKVEFNGVVDMMHYGDQGIIDLAALLTFLVNKNNTDSSYAYMDRLIGMNATLEFIDFFFISESRQLASNLTFISEYGNMISSSSGRSGSEKTLIVVVTLLSITLIALASVLCWIGGGWLALRRQVKILLQREEEMTRMTQQDGIQPKRTEETEDDDQCSPSRDSQTNFTNPSGILGVYGMNGYTMDKLQGLGIKTPGRATNGETDDHDLATPMSTFSDTDRAPIGIMSMRKLVGPDAMSQRDESDEEGAEDDCDIENFGMKKLEY
ncbi:hypothetical protein IV203_000848 [Nitzschia inconspicua]|uniref:Uncharacterized protein n=1 Tax=Nitzschia inconspicua TaxID=303405 RepID=A0A9K3L647_9STRA|nr:hypothetical protein IV203_000848 [Nitzschia inconspicua]